MTRWAWVWLPVAFMLMCAGWALTSPPGSAPDDDYHLSSIWCAQGEREGRCESAPGDPDARLVPRNVAQASDCFRYDAAITAGCTSAVRNDATLVVTDRVNVVQGLYPAPFYAAMSVLVGPDVERSVLAMRLANAAIAAFLLAALLRLTPPGVAASAIGAIVVTFVPLGLFIVPSTNPSSWAVIGIATYWAFALAFLRHRRENPRRGLLLGILSCLSAAIAIGSRLDASSFVVLATVLAVTLNGWRRSASTPGRLVVLGTVCVVAIVSYLSISARVLAGDDLGTTDAGPGLLITNLVYLPVLVQGALGGWGLGWNDTVMPPLVAFVGVAAVGALVYRGLADAPRRTLVGAAIAFMALVAVPIVFLQSQQLGVGEVVQPRYLLPLLTLLMGVLGLGARLSTPLPLPTVPAAVLAVALSVSAVLAYWANARRYAAGGDAGLFDLKVDPAWLSSTGMPLWITTLATGLASIAFVAGAFMVMSRSVARR